MYGSWTPQFRDRPPEETKVALVLPLFHIFGLSVVLLAAFWVYPRLEAQWLATPVRAEYFDGDFTLIGYRLSDEVLAPGDTLSVFIRVDTLEAWQWLTLDHVAFGHLRLRGLLATGVFGRSY